MSVSALVEGKQSWRQKVPEDMVRKWQKAVISEKLHNIIDFKGNLANIWMLII